jgi:acetyl-CoA carboxylase biotin carboxyl carrier protein
MDFDEINRILEVMRQHDLAEFELEREGFKIRLRKGGGAQLTSIPVVPQTDAPAAETASRQAPPSPPVFAAANEALELVMVKSPIVGTFYRSPEPGARAFAEVGETIRKGQVLCIIEAMKLMNEINAECDGEIVKAFVENGQAVQYGERLFAIKPL